MREILFRAKRLDNSQWVYGLYSTTKGDRGRFHYLSTDAAYVRIIPETLGEFTGLTDKNSAKIFEGDIIRSYGLLGNEIRHTIVWDDEWAKFRAITDAYYHPSELSQSWIDEYEKEIIGNIHDKKQ